MEVVDVEEEGVEEVEGRGGRCGGGRGGGGGRWQSCQLSRILRETHAFRHNLTLTRIITSISRAEQAVYITHIIYTHHGVYAGRNQDGVIIAAS